MEPVALASKATKSKEMGEDRRKSADEEIFLALKNEKTSERFLLGVPLNDVKNFQACCQRENLPPSVRKRLMAMIKSGTGNFDAILSRKDLSAQEITTIARSPLVGPREAKLLISHPAFNHQALGELAFIEERRLRGRRERGLGQAEVSGHILGILRNTNTLTRVGVILLDEDLAANPAEIAHALDVIMGTGPSTLETFLVLAKGWVGSLEDLLIASQELS